MRRRKNAEGGFTLLEMLAVILIMSIGISLLAFGINHSLEGARDRQVRSDLITALRVVRNQAVIKNRSTMLRFDLTRNAYQVEGQAAYYLPEGMHIRLTTAAGLAPQDGVIEFYPGGSSSGGNIYLEGGLHMSRIDIAWLTGKVTWQDVKHP